MTVPAAPLPSIDLLLRSLRGSASKGERWVGGRQGYVARVYTRGSFALSAGIQAVGKMSAMERVTVWCPGYFCNEALSPLRKLPLVLKFYPIREDLSPDWSALEELCRYESGVQIFIIVHYFGFPNAISKARAFCDLYGMVLLEDSAHVLVPVLPVGLGDLLVFSPRKLLAIPSGGILIVSQDLASYIENVSGIPNRGEVLHWLCRRLTQRLLLQLHIPWQAWWAVRRSGLLTKGQHALSTPDLWACEPYALKLLSTMEQEINKVAELRRRNYMRLREWVDGLEQAKPLFPALPETVCPYAFPMVLDYGSEEIVAKLQSLGIPASQWPDLPPEVLANEAEYKIAIQMSKQLMLLPVHQSLTPNQLDMVGRHLRETLSVSFQKISDGSLSN